MLLKLLAIACLIQISAQFFFPRVTEQSCCCGAPPPPPPSCGCCGGGGFGRRKRDIGHVRGHIIHEEDNHDDINNQCNSNELSEVILKHINLESPKASRDAIYKELDAIYPESMFTVVCVGKAVTSFQADAQRYCIEGRDNRSCYVFEF